MRRMLIGRGRSVASLCTAPGMLKDAGFHRTRFHRFAGNWIREMKRLTRETRLCTFGHTRSVAICTTRFSCQPCDIKFTVRVLSGRTSVVYRVRAAGGESRVVSTDSLSLSLSRPVLYSAHFSHYHSYCRFICAAYSQRRHIARETCYTRHIAFTASVRSVVALQSRDASRLSLKSGLVVLNAAT